MRPRPPELGKRKGLSVVKSGRVAMCSVGSHTECAHENCFSKTLAAYILLYQSFNYHYFNTYPYGFQILFTVHLFLINLSLKMREKTSHSTRKSRLFEISVQQWTDTKPRLCKLSTCDKLYGLSKVLPLNHIAQPYK